MNIEPVAKPVIGSLLEDDLYKFTMQQAMLHRHPDAQAEYTFLCRSTPEFPLSELKRDVERELDRLCNLRFQDDELAYLDSIRFLKSDYIDFLSLFHLQRRFIQVEAVGKDLAIVARGPQVHVMKFEMPVLSTVSELYFHRFDQEALLAEGRRRLHAKIAALKDFIRNEPPHRHPLTFVDFGLRRRFSRAWQDEVVATLKHEVPEQFKGTSNVYLARKHNLTAVGTMAHEYLQSYQAYGVRLRDFQKAALEDWVQEYRGDLGIALTDVVGMDAFLADFDLYFAKLFDGARQDSGDPHEWTEKYIAHLEGLRIDPNTKRAVFSNSLDFQAMFNLYRPFADRIFPQFGIGTNLTNDMGVKPLNIVMKLTRCNGQPVAKLSDDPGKTMCDDEVFLAYLRQVFNHHNT